MGATSTPPQTPLNGCRVLYLQRIIPLHSASNVSPALPIVLLLFDLCNTFVISSPPTVNDEWNDQVGDPLLLIDRQKSVSPDMSGAFHVTQSMETSRIQCVFDVAPGYVWCPLNPKVILQCSLCALSDAFYSLQTLVSDALILQSSLQVSHSSHRMSPNMFGASLLCLFLFVFIFSVGLFLSCVWTLALSSQVFNESSIVLL